jgi:hypothetical protein
VAIELTESPLPFRGASPTAAAGPRRAPTPAAAALGGGGGIEALGAAPRRPRGAAGWGGESEEEVPAVAGRWSVVVTSAAPLTPGLPAASPEPVSPMLSPLEGGVRLGRRRRMPQWPGSDGGGGGASSAAEGV